MRPPDWPSALARLAFGSGSLAGHSGSRLSLPGRCSVCSSGCACAASWHDAAAAVDAHYGLKDRAVTALAFADQPTPTDLHSMQIATRSAHLGTVEPKAVVPMKAPRAGRSRSWRSPPRLSSAGVAARRNAKPRPARRRCPNTSSAVAADQKEKLAALDKKLAETAQDLEDDKADDDKKGLKDLLEKLTAEGRGD